MTRRRVLTEAQARYIRRAVKLRQRLTNKALCARFKVSEPALVKYAYERHTGDLGRSGVAR
jgi:hypothetical protein